MRKRRSFPVNVEPRGIYPWDIPVEKDVPMKAVKPGLLRMMLWLPVEIFAEVCGFLDPLDLRNLSISGHTFRDVLMSRESQQIWIAARLRMYGANMPPPPTDMSEPQYVRLLFDPQCYTCEGKANEIDYFNRVKSCNDCFQKNHLTPEEAKEMYPGLPVHHMHSPPLVGWSYWDLKRPHYKSKVDPEYNMYLNQKSSVDPERLAIYEIDLEERCRVIAETGTDIRIWMYDEEGKQKQEVQDIYNRREDSIRARMIGLGRHDKKDIYCGVADDFGLLFLPHEVTDEEWAVMRFALEERAERNKIRRLAYQLPYDSDDEVY